MAADIFLVPIRIRGEDAPISGDTFDFKPELTSGPTAVEARPVIDCEGSVFLAHQIGIGGSGDGHNDGGFTDDLAVDPTNPNAEVDHTEFQIVKLLDASTPKAQMAGISDGTSNTLMVGEILPEPTTAADDGSIPTETLSLNFDYFGVPNTKALPGLPMTVDPTNPNADAPTGRTDGIFTVVLPSVPAVQDDGLLLPY